MFDPIRRYCERRLGGWGGPTSDLYFANACGDALRQGRVERLSPTVFATDRAVLVMRHGAGLDLAHVLAGKRLIWLIDDDVWAGVADRALGLRHRAKLALVERWSLSAFAPRVDDLVVSSPVLMPLAAKIAPRADVTSLRPYWTEPLAGLAHFDASEWIDIACLGAATHQADLNLIWPALTTALEASDRTRVWFSANHRPPPSLQWHERLHLIEEIRWPDYRAALRSRRFHIALYPMRDTAFNQTRSVNKIIEHAVVGAAGLYPSSWPETARVLEAGAGREVGAEPADWTKALLDLVDDTLSGGEAARKLAVAQRELAASLNDPESQRRFWSHAGLT